MLPAFPPRIAKLPRTRIMGLDCPVPFFVTWFDDKGEPTRAGEGTPDFRVADERKWGLAIRSRLCWVCGEKLGTHLAFVLGPMCTVTRTTSEPACHHDCAIFSATACPFLTRPHMRRNDKDIPDAVHNPAGVAIMRNPGVACVWITKSFSVFKAQGGGSGYLLSVGDPTTVLWFAEGKAATREQVMASIDTGYPALLDMAKPEGDKAIAALAKQRERAMVYVPAV